MSLATYILLAFLFGALGGMVAQVLKMRHLPTKQDVERLHNMLDEVEQMIKRR